MIPDHRQFRDSSRFGLAVASEVAAPLLRVLARAASRAGPSSPDQWRHGVILGHGHIGDVLYRTCALELLQRGLPECEWSYLTTSVGAEVLAGNPSLGEILPWMIDSDAQQLAPDRYSELAERRFDVALCSENVAHHRALLLALKLGLPNRVAFTRRGLSGLATVHVDLPGPMSRPHQFRYMVQQITGLRDASPLRPRVFPSHKDRISANHEWARHELDSGEFVIACAVTTRQTIGDFPPELFTDILRRALQAAPTARVLLSGSATDRPFLDALARELGDRAATSTGVLGVLGYADLLKRCAVFVGVDSGPRHLANAAGIPVFFVRNMATSAVDAGAYCSTETDIAPAGEYLSVHEMRNALNRIDRSAVATALVSAARRQVCDKPEGTRL